MKARARTKTHQLDKVVRKIDAKLRVIANGDLDVNIARTERVDALCVARPSLLKGRRQTMHAGVFDAPRGPARKKGHMRQAPDGILANVFISTSDPRVLPRSIAVEKGRVGTLATATVKLSQLKKIASHPSVRNISLGQGLRDPDPVRHGGAVKKPHAQSREVAHASLHHFGKDVLVAIIDVEGFDFAHPDFLDENGETRFEAIWDQGAEPDGTVPERLGYGRIISRERMNQAIAASNRARASERAPATMLEPQSEMAPGSHGTHVASIAAGKLGVARKARIVGVLISLGGDDIDRRGTFYDSTRLAHAVDWVMNFPKEALKKPDMPVSVNVSLGTNGHAHDSSAPLNRWIDALLTVPGRCVCVAAGNAGQEKGRTPDDFGYVMGRIHTDGRIAAAGLSADIEWVVAGAGGGRDYSENELEIWFSAQDKIGVQVREPGGKWHAVVNPLEFVENRQLSDGSFLSIYNDLYHSANGANYIGIFLSPNLKAEPIVGVTAGQWVVRLVGQDIRDGRYHGWIERDDPDPLPGRPEEAPRWRFPSYFSESSNRDYSSISTLACGNRIVAVANLDAEREMINITSSQGPTRDARQKPDIAAPGTRIVAAKGFSTRDDQWVALSGTSMASPYVCGVVALMFATQRDLTAAQINGILQRSARPLSGKDYAWQNDAGYGAIDPAGCIEEAKRVNDPKDRT